VVIQVVVGERESSMVGIEFLGYQLGILGFIKKRLIGIANRERVDVGAVLGG
jgi:hypothetical protein